MGTTKDENAVRHSGPDPESSYKRLDTGIRGYDDVFYYKTLNCEFLTFESEYS